MKYIIYGTIFSGAVNSSNSTNSFCVLPDDAAVGDFVEVIVVTFALQGRTIYHGTVEGSGHLIYTGGYTNTWDGQNSGSYSSSSGHWLGSTDKNKREIFTYVASNTWLSARF